MKKENITFQITSLPTRKIQRGRGCYQEISEFSVCKSASQLKDMGAFHSTVMKVLSYQVLGRTWATIMLTQRK